MLTPDVNAVLFKKLKKKIASDDTEISGYNIVKIAWRKLCILQIFFMVEAAAGAIAAPILLASVIPRSVIVPIEAPLI